MRYILLACALLLAPVAARAHAILMQSTPADRGTLAPGSQQLTLRYNSRIDHARSRLTLMGTNAQAVLPLDDKAPSDVLAATADLSPGDYVLHWQVLAVDGHMTRGDVRFNVPEQGSSNEGASPQNPSTQGPSGR